MLLLCTHTGFGRFSCWLLFLVLCFVQILSFNNFLNFHKKEQTHTKKRKKTKKGKIIIFSFSVLKQWIKNWIRWTGEKKQKKEWKNTTTFPNKFAAAIFFIFFFVFCNSTCSLLLIRLLKLDCWNYICERWCCAFFVWMFILIFRAVFIFVLLLLRISILNVPFHRKNKRNKCTKISTRRK